MSSKRIANRVDAPRKLSVGFTLVELLVVIGIIAILIAILMPALSKVRDQARTVKCAANLRSVGQGLMIYVAQNNGAFPAAYHYVGEFVDPGSGVQGPADAAQGYVHWSSYLYSQGNQSVPLDAFQCPSIENGGLPPTNPPPDDFDDGQSADNAGVVDEQARRCAYTVNEAVCPRNKWVIGFQGAARPYRYVKAGIVKGASETVLATEWHQNWRIVSDFGRSNPGETVCKSHRPVHGWTAGGQLNLEMVAPFGGRQVLYQAKVYNLARDPQPGQSSETRLDWVGRNHGRRVLDSNGWDMRKTNFLYCDGHVETKHIRETLQPVFEWGQRFYTLEGPG
jgi:prepilin-type N-terminal cleavage/methylation domain-containing protein/prepilin-type processing-associated H-X9-DG protein